MRNPFRREPPAEKRQYTDALVQIIQSRAAGADDADALRTSAVEIAAGIYARAFASAGVDGIELTAADRAAVARDLIVAGESVWWMDGGRPMRAASHVVSGASCDEREWRYRIESARPDGNRTYNAPGADVAHVRYSADKTQPWIGIPPLKRALSGASLAGNIEQKLGEEASGTVGYVLPAPVGGADDSVSALKNDLGSLKGKTAIVETMAGGFGEGRTSAPQADWSPRRIGPTFGADAVPEVYRLSQMSVLAALGVPVELVHPGSGTGDREAYRRFLHGSVAPLGRLCEEQFSKLAKRPVKLDWDQLFASDIMGRARAWQSLVGSGMEPDTASEIVGFREDGGRA